MSSDNINSTTTPVSNELAKGGGDPQDSKASVDVPVAKQEGDSLAVKKDEDGLSTEVKSAAAAAPDNTKTITTAAHPENGKTANLSVSPGSHSLSVRIHSSSNTTPKPESSNEKPNVNNPPSDTVIPPLTDEDKESLELYLSLWVEEGSRNVNKEVPTIEQLSSICKDTSVHVSHVRKWFYERGFTDKVVPSTTVAAAPSVAIPSGKLVEHREYVDIFILTTDSAKHEGSTRRKTTTMSPIISDVSTSAPKDDDTTTKVLHKFQRCLIAFTIDEALKNHPPSFDALYKKEMDKLKKKILRKFLLAEERPLFSHEQKVVSSLQNTIAHKTITNDDRKAFIDSLWPARVKLPSRKSDIRDYYGFEVFLTNDHHDEVGPIGEDGLTPDGRKPHYLYTKDSWVQCDSCEKWRRLPDHVDVSALPSSWFCGMNRWDLKHNKCSVEEEITHSHADLVGMRKRVFAKDFHKHMKAMEKSYSELKYADMKEDGAKRNYVRCSKCFKKRAVLAGMDYRKIPHPFVCWMNKWDELHSSCYIPEEKFNARSMHPNAIASGVASYGSSAAAGKKRKKTGGSTNTTTSNDQPKSKKVGRKPNASKRSSITDLSKKKTSQKK